MGDRSGQRRRHCRNRVSPGDIQASYLRLLESLEEFGPFEVGMFYVRPMQHELWEMRM